MSEAGLHFIKARLRDVILDPDAQIQAMITHLFETFLRIVSASSSHVGYAVASRWSSNR